MLLMVIKIQQNLSSALRLSLGLAKALPYEDFGILFQIRKRPSFASS